MRPPILHTAFRYCTVVGCLLGAAACAPGFDDTKSLTEIKSANKGVAFITVTFGRLSCSPGNIFLATEPSPGNFELFSAFMIGGMNAPLANTRQISLPAGTYHVGALQCVSSGHMVRVGELDGLITAGNPKQSLASFSIAAGEAVDLGHVDFSPTDYLANSGVISVRPLDDLAMNRLRNGVPTLSSQLTTRFMTITSPGQTYTLSWQKLGGL